jgi:trypsin-like peptidase
MVNIKVTSIAKMDFPDQLFGEEFPFPGFRMPSPQQPRQFRRQGTGSGFIIRKDGVILTNNHLVDNAQEITVTLTDKRQYKAKVLGHDPKTDVAVIRRDIVRRLVPQYRVKFRHWVTHDTRKKRGNRLVLRWPVPFLSPSFTHHFSQEIRITPRITNAVAPTFRCVRVSTSLRSSSARGSTNRDEALTRGEMMETRSRLSAV